MTDTQTMTLDSLRDIGLGPNRIARALEGEMLFGPGGGCSIPSNWFSSWPR